MIAGSTSDEVIETFSLKFTKVQIPPYATSVLVFSLFILVTRIIKSEKTRTEVYSSH
jgi:hypothetical protein